VLMDEPSAVGAAAQAQPLVAFMPAKRR
jgi:hypothetical protein